MPRPLKMDLSSWEPKTKLGKQVKEGVITSLDEIFAKKRVIKEPEIVFYLLPNLEYEVLDRRIVVKMSGTGRKRKIAVLVVIGNREGYVGLGYAKSKETAAALRKAINDAALNIIKVVRGCGSWQCRCGRPHSIPFRTVGKSGSVEVHLLPAPRGTGLVVGDVAKRILELAGIKDVWSKSFGQTKTTINFAKAVYFALKNLYKYRVAPEISERLGIKA
ncbi:MAG: 30S ribosomal protein S5 [bacterium]|nr:30S ribosomal protein S5 [bacterium]